MKNREAAGLAGLAEKLKAAIECFQEIQRAGGELTERDVFEELVNVAYAHFTQARDAETTA